MFAVGWMELRDPSRAQVLLSKSFINATEPFKVSLASAHYLLPPSSPSVVVSAGEGSQPHVPAALAACRCGRRMRMGLVL